MGAAKKGGKGEGVDKSRKTCYIVIKKGDMHQ